MAYVPRSRPCPAFETTGLRRYRRNVALIEAQAAWSGRSRLLGSRIEVKDRAVCAASHPESRVGSRFPANDVRSGNVRQRTDQN